MRSLEIEHTIVEHQILVCLLIFVVNSRMSIKAINFLVRCTGDESNLYTVHNFCCTDSGRKKYDARQEKKYPIVNLELFHGAKVLKSWEF